MNKQKIREHFRDVVFKRDGKKCAFCDETKELDAHHIMDRNYFTNGGYILENGITLCQKIHHFQAELYHSTNAQDYAIGMHPDDLYKMIGSSFEEAIEADGKNS